MISELSPEWTKQPAASPLNPNSSSGFLYFFPPCPSPFFTLFVSLTIPQLAWNGANRLFHSLYSKNWRTHRSKFCFCQLYFFSLNCSPRTHHCFPCLTTISPLEMDFLQLSSCKTRALFSASHYEWIFPLALAPAPGSVWKHEIILIGLFINLNLLHI